MMRLEFHPNTCDMAVDSQKPCPEGPEILGFRTHIGKHSAGSIEETTWSAPDLNWFALRREVRTSANGKLIATEEAIRAERYATEPIIQIPMGYTPETDFIEFSAAQGEARGLPMTQEYREKLRQRESRRREPPSSPALVERYRALKAARQACSLGLAKPQESGMPKL
jgi:hypothetical protein